MAPLSFHTFTDALPQGGVGTGDHLVDRLDGSAGALGDLGGLDVLAIAHREGRLGLVA